MRRTLPTTVAVVAAAAAVLTGCVGQPPPPPAVETTEPATPTPSSTPDAGSTPDASPSPSADTPEPSTDPGLPGSGPVLSIDGVPGGTWVSTLRCSFFTPTALQLTGDTADTSGSLVGSISVQDGVWGSVGILLTDDDRAYFQLAEFAPATVESNRLTIAFEASDMSGATVDVVLGVDCIDLT